MHLRSLDKVKPSNISPLGESSFPHRMLGQFRSPPMTALERWREFRFPSRKDRRIEGSEFGGLYIYMIRMDSSLIVITAAAESLEMS